MNLGEAKNSNLEEWVPLPAVDGGTIISFLNSPTAYRTS